MAGKSDWGNVGVSPSFTRRRFVVGCAAAVGVPIAVQAQVAGKVWRIGYLTPAELDRRPLIEALRDLDYIEGQTLRRSSLRGRQPRPPSSAGDSAGTRKGRHHCGGQSAGHSSGKSSNESDPHRHGIVGWRRSSRIRHRRKLRSAWRQRHGCVHICSGAGRQATRVALGRTAQR